MTSITGLRYVTSLFELAREQGRLNEVESGIRQFARLLEENPDLRVLILNPRIAKEQKKRILLKLAEESFDPMLRDFFCLLVDKGRERILLFLEQEFSKLLMESRNILSATLQTPVPLGEEFKGMLARRFAEMTGKTVDLNEEVKPELIAGVRLLMGSKMLDGSLKARLEGMRRHLLQKSRARS